MENTFRKEIPDLRPFDIVTAFYTDFNGRVKTDYKGNAEPSLFLIIAVHNDLTVTACKITSKKDAGNFENNYTLRLETYPFLQKESYVQTDKINTLSILKCRKAGSMPDFCRRGFVNKFTGVIGKIRMSLEDYCPQYISPSRDMRR